jgi:hypothetical protein
MAHFVGAVLQSQPTEAGKTSVTPESEYGKFLADALKRARRIAVSVKLQYQESCEGTKMKKVLPHEQLLRMRRSVPAVAD